MSSAHGSAPGDRTAAGSSSPRALSSSSSRKTLRTVSSTSSSSSSTDPGAHPLLGGPAAEPGAPGSYAVYDKNSRRQQRVGSGAHSVGVVSPPTSTLAAHEGPLAPSPSAASTATTPPFTPSSTHSLPPLISRPSSTQLPPPAQGRQYARSVSEAKEQLQRQALKAELQDLGLSAESAGAALVARLGTLEDDPDLKSLSAAVRSGKLTLLLPAERLDPEGQIGLPFLLDHLILLDPPSTASDSSILAVERPFASLSGLRGLLTGGELVFTSCVTAPKGEGSFAYDNEGFQRSLRGVTPLPAPPTFAHYPSSTLISAITTLSIPQTRSTAVVAPPPASRTTSRLAALFAKSGGQASEPASNATVPDSSTPSPFADVPEARSTSQSHQHSVEVPVLAVGKTIRHDDVTGTISTALLAHLRRQCRAIEGISGETDVAAVIDAFARQFQPPPTLTTTVSSGPGLSGDHAPATTSLLDADVETRTEAYQEMMHDLRLDLARNLGSVDATDPSAAVPSLEDFAQLEERIDVSLEKLEAAVTSTMYDRLFAPPQSHDLQEDENLASRIAALNVLGLDLEHLGIDLDPDQELEDEWHRHNTGPRDSLEALASRVGKELNRLEDPSELTPTAKLAILVACHKIIVDGLSDLPGIRLKKDISADDKSASDRPAVVEMDDASSRSSSLPPSRPRSPTPNGLTGEAKEDDLLRTPRPPSLEERPVPEIRLPDAAQGLSASVLDATSSPMLSQTSSPPTSVFETSRSRGRSSPTASNSSSADLILPLLIYSVVRANPPHLISHLRYIHRFRAESLLRGQASYCATNFDAVIEWSQHVDLSTLGLSSENVIAGAPGRPEQQAAAPSSARPRAYTTPSTFLRERVSLTADQLVDSANSALTGVVDSSYRLLFGAGGLASSAPRSLEDVKNVLDGARGRAREKLPFRRSNSARDFPTLIAGRRRATSTASGPAATIAETGGGTDALLSQTTSPLAAPPPLPPRPQSPVKDAEDSDTRSVRSVSSFLGFRDSTIGRAIASHAGGHASDRQLEAAAAASPENSPSSTSLGGRLLGRIADGATSSARRATLLNPLSSWSSPAAPGLAPVPASPADDDRGEEYQPRQRFLDVESAQDLKLGEVQELLLEYRKAVTALRSRPAEPREAIVEHHSDAVDAPQTVEEMSLPLAVENPV
ncbi:hypothetical protein JCM3774_003931 [Rhodotorula dairenensis]